MNITVCGKITAKHARGNVQSMDIDGDGYSTLKLPQPHIPSHGHQCGLSEAPSFQ